MYTKEHKAIYDWINALLEDFENDERAKNIAIRLLFDSHEKDIGIGFVFNVNAEHFNYECWFDSVADFIDKRERDALFYIGVDEDDYIIEMAPEGPIEEFYGDLMAIYALMQYCETKIAKFLHDHPIEAIEDPSHTARLED